MMQVVCEGSTYGGEVLAWLDVERGDSLVDMSFEVQLFVSVVWSDRQQQAEKCAYSNLFQNSFQVT
jgi:hypothetical protein